MFKRSTWIVDPGPSFRMRRLWTLWRKECDVTESRDVMYDVTNRRAVCTFLYAPYLTQTPKSHSFRHI